MRQYITLVLVLGVLACARRRPYASPTRDGEMRYLLEHEYALTPGDYAIYSSRWSDWFYVKYSPWINHVGKCKRFVWIGVRYVSCEEIYGIIWDGRSAPLPQCWLNQTLQ